MKGKFVTFVVGCTLLIVGTHGFASGGLLPLNTSQHPASTTAVARSTALRPASTTAATFSTALRPASTTAVARSTALRPASTTAATRSTAQRLASTTAATRSTALLPASTTAAVRSPAQRLASTTAAARSTAQLPSVAPTTAAQTLTLATFTERAFAATGAQMSGYAIHDWSQLSYQFESVRQIGEIVDKLGQELGIQMEKKIQNNIAGDGHSGQTFSEVYGTWADSTNISVTVSSFRFRTGQEETILVISVTSNGHNLTDYQGDVVRIQKALTSIGASQQISACIEGSRGDMMSGGQAQLLIKHAFESVGATSVEGVQTSELSSVSGYSAESPQYILTRGRKMNIQIGIHNDTVHQRTNIVVGTPIITVTY